MNLGGKLVTPDQKQNKPPVFGFYWRKFFLFAAIIVVAVAVRFAVKPFSADVINFAPSDTNNNLSVAVDIQNDGSIQVNGKTISDRVNVISGADEVRFPVVDNIGYYYDNLTVTMTLPANVANDSMPQAIGIHGVNSTNAQVTSDNTIIYTAQGLSPTATVSLIAEMPTGTIQEPFIYKTIRILGGLQFNAWGAIGVSLPILTFLALIIFIAYQMRTQKIDIPTAESSAPPMALPPAIVGVLYHQQVGSREIAATLIDLALRGDIFIMDRIRDFAFTKNKFDQRLLSYEKILLSKIFTAANVSDRAEIESRISNHLYSKKISLVTSGIYMLSTRLGYFRMNPQKAHLKYQVFGITLFFVALIGFIMSLSIFPNPPYVAFFWIGMMVSSLIISFLSFNIPIRTPLGKEALTNWLSFRNFLSNVDKIPYSYASQPLFEKYLPYAIVLDCEVAWAKRFTEQNFTLPNWFVSEKNGLSLQDFCLSLFPIVSYVSRGLASVREPGFD